MAAMKSYVDVVLSPSLQHYISNNTMIGRLWNKASAAFWRADFWLPSGLQWEDLVDTEDLRYPNFHDVYVYPLIFGAMILLVKSFFLTPYLLDPLARYAGFSPKRPSPPYPCKALEAVFRRYNHNPPKEVLTQASQDSGMSTRQAERWLRRRKACTQTTPYDKFTSSGFNLICHTALTIYGFIVMYSKPWVYDISVAWKNYPHHHVDDDMWWYYIGALSYYWASAFLQVTSPGRSSSDKLQMLLHHLFTILLIMFSWVCNFIRSGSLVLVLHEVGDVPLLTAKMFNYAGVKGVTEVLFLVFIITWAVTRCYLYPFWFMRAVLMQTGKDFQTPAFKLQYMLVSGLLVINLVWTFLIARIVVRKVTAGALEDVRSEAEDVTTDSEDNEKQKTK